MLESEKVQESKKNYNKRRKKVQWKDRLRPSTSMTNLPAKFAVYRNFGSKSKPR